MLCVTMGISDMMFRDDEIEKADHMVHEIVTMGKRQIDGGVRQPVRTGEAEEM